MYKYSKVSLSLSLFHSLSDSLFCFTFCLSRSRLHSLSLSNFLTLSRLVSYLFYLCPFPSLSRSSLSIFPTLCISLFFTILSSLSLLLFSHTMYLFFSLTIYIIYIFPLFLIHCIFPSLSQFYLFCIFPSI